jgi:hypothetical protein
MLIERFYVGDGFQSGNQVASENTPGSPKWMWQVLRYVRSLWAEQKTKEVWPQFCYQVPDKGIIFSAFIS